MDERPLTLTALRAARDAAIARGCDTGIRRVLLIHPEDLADFAVVYGAALGLPEPAITAVRTLREIDGIPVEPTVYIARGAWKVIPELALRQLGVERASKFAEIGAL